MQLFLKKFSSFTNGKAAEGVDFDYFAFGKKIASFYKSEGIESNGTIEKFFDRPSFDACKQEMDKFVSMFTLW